MYNRNPKSMVFFSRHVVTHMRCFIVHRPPSLQTNEKRLLFSRYRRGKEQKKKHKTKKPTFVASVHAGNLRNYA